MMTIQTLPIETQQLLVAGCAIHSLQRCLQLLIERSM
jgi:hypothetical protein